MEGPQWWGDVAVRASLGWAGAGWGSGQMLSPLAGSATTSRAWKGWEQVRGSCVLPPLPAASGEQGSPQAQPPAARLGGHRADAASLFSPDITVICPWEAFSHLELHELAQYGII